MVQDESVWRLAQHPEHLPTEAQIIENRLSVETTKLALIVLTKDMDSGSRAVLLSHVSEEKDNIKGYDCVGTWTSSPRWWCVE